MSILHFPKKKSRRHAVAPTGSDFSGASASSSNSRSSEISGNAVIISGQTSRGNWLRCFQARTAPGRLPTFSAKAEGPPFSSINEAADIIELTLPTVTQKDKPGITRRNVTVGNVAGMNQANGWQDLTGGWERLRWARTRWQAAAGVVNGSAKDAADSLGIKAGTYRAYERQPGSSKHTPLDDQAAIQFGRRFRVSWTWLLTGEGTPFDDQLPPVMERVVRIMARLPDADQAMLAEMAEAFARRTGTKG